MKKHAVCFTVVLVLALVFCGSAFAAAPFHIGVATLTVSQAEDTYRELKGSSKSMVMQRQAE